MAERSLRFPPWARAVLVAIIVIAADQITKQAIRSSIARGEERHVLPGVSFVNTRNSGVAFGFLPGDETVVTILIALALLALLAYFLRNPHRPLVWLPTGMLFGGALGNILDRIRWGSVTDFVKLPLGFPPFNLADSCITVGMVILVLVVEASVGRPRSAERGSRGDRHTASSPR